MTGRRRGEGEGDTGKEIQEGEMRDGGGKERIGLGKGRKKKSWIGKMVERDLRREYSSSIERGKGHKIRKGNRDTAFKRKQKRDDEKLRKAGSEVPIDEKTGEPYGARVH